MDTTKELISFIKQKSMDGALLLTGKWGCGKSYIIKSLKNKLKVDKGCPALVVIVSLFGVNTTEDLHKLVREAVFQDCYECFGQFGKKLPKMNKYAEIIGRKYSLVNIIGALVNEGIYDLAPVKPEYRREVDGEDILYKLVLVFDDFERCSLSESDLIGCINSYTENKKIKTILIANEEKMDGEKYKEYKEKLIARTVKAEPNYSQIIYEIVEGFEETSHGYHTFLKDSLSKLTALFHESGEENLRSIKAVISNFERVYEHLFALGLNEKMISTIMYSFGALTIEQRAGRSINEEYNKFGFLGSDWKKRYINFDDRIRLVSSLLDWIMEGNWSEDQFLYEVEQIFFPEKRSSVELFLTSNFWDLDMNVVNEGLSAALDMAYSGELDADNMIELLQRIHQLKKYNVLNENQNAAIDYEKITQGFYNRMRKIEKGQIVEPSRHRFSLIENLDKEAHKLYKIVENLSDQIPLWQNKRDFIAYLRETTSENPIQGEKKAMEVFDEELLEETTKAYRKNNNAMKRDIAITIISLHYNKEKLRSSIENLEKLKETIRKFSLDEPDRMTVAINTAFVQELENKINALNEQSSHP